MIANGSIAFMLSIKLNKMNNIPVPVQQYLKYGRNGCNWLFPLGNNNSEVQFDLLTEQW